MPPATLALIVGLVEEAIKDTPELVAEFQKIFAIKNATPADWQALKTTVLAENYEQYVPDSAISLAQSPVA